jgi:hypothetical protein
VVGPVAVPAPTTPAPPPAEEGTSADPRFWGPLLFRGNIDYTACRGMQSKVGVTFKPGHNATKKVVDNLIYLLLNITA